MQTPGSSPRKSRVAFRKNLEVSRWSQYVPQRRSESAGTPRRMRTGRFHRESTSIATEIKRSSLQKRKASSRKSLVFVVHAPIHFSVVTLVIEREAGLHERRKIAADGLRRDHMVLGQIQYRGPARGFNLLENGPLPK